MTTAIQPGTDGQWHFVPPTVFWEHINIAMVKDYAQFRATPTRPGARYLHLGYGNKIIEDRQWDHLDRPDWDAMTDPLPYNVGSVAGIVAYHMLDHLSDPRPLLRECERVLEDNGWMVIVVPHYSSELWNSDVDHKSRYATDTWKNIMSDIHYANTGKWHLRVGFNMLFGFTERNLCLITQLIREPRQKANPKLNIPARAQAEEYPMPGTPKPVFDRELPPPTLTKMPARSRNPESDPVTVRIQGKVFSFHKDREYRLTTMTRGIQRKPRYWRLQFLGPGGQHHDAYLQFNGRGPDRTHAGRYCGTVDIHPVDILFAEEVSRNVSLRYAGQRQALDGQAAPGGRKP
jgi:SAM-dependent methyltransferase